MPDLAPFNGIRYDSALVDLAEVTAPPYDVISASERADLEAASPHNVVRLILGPLGAEAEKYSRARELLQEWISQKILVEDPEPAVYLYEETFDLDGKRRRQAGILAAVTISDDILPHERTMGPVVADRLEVIRSVEANLSPVFCLYWAKDDAAEAAIDSAMKGEPFADFVTGDGIGHRAWQITNPTLIAALASTLASARVVIADGHHRYRTAEAYRDEMRATRGPGPWDQMLLYLVDAKRDAPVLQPIHRLVRNVSPAEALELLRPLFSIEPGPRDADALATELASRRSEGRCYGILSSEDAWVVTLKDESAGRAATESEHCEAWRDLDVAVLHELVFTGLLAGPDVTYVHHPAEAEEAVTGGDASFAVLLAPTPVDAVLAVAEAHDSMPPKSTFFVPKPRTGIVLRPI